MRNEEIDALIVTISIDCYRLIPNLDFRFLFKHYIQTTRIDSTSTFLHLLSTFCQTSLPSLDVVTRILVLSYSLWMSAGHIGVSPRGVRIRMYSMRSLEQFWVCGTKVRKNIAELDGRRST
jgi:hypothetical protein